MKLRALHLTNVRKFTGKRASITGIGDGITVVSEANEFGKSTFFDAIHALFFEKYSATGRAVKSLQPYAGGAVEIAAEVETDAGHFRIEKRFLSRKAARIARLPKGTTLAQDDEAERWIAALLGTGREGPAGLLWVRQGLVGLEPDSPKEKSQLMETRRDLLSSVAGEIDAMTGGRRMDRVMRRVTDRLAPILTKTGRKTGPWKAALDEIETLERTLAGLNAQVAMLDKALVDRKQAEASLKRLDDVDAKARRDASLAAAKTELDKARAHAGAVTAARQARDLAALTAKGAQSDLDSFLSALEVLQTAEKREAQSTTALADAADEETRQKSALDRAQRHLKSTIDIATGARRALDAARRQTAARAAQTEAARLDAQIADAEAALGNRDAARAVMRASPATAEWLRRAEQAQDAVAKLEAAAQTRATTLSMAYAGATRITRNGRDLPADRPVTLDGETRLELPGIGTMTIRPQNVDEAGKAQLAKAKAARDALFSQAGAVTLQDGRALAATRSEATAAADLAQAILDTLAPDGIEVLRTAKADADLAAAGAHGDALPPIAELEARVSEAEQAQEAAQRLLDGADTDHARARDALMKAQATAEAAQHALDRARTDAGPPEIRKSRRAELLRGQAMADEALTTADAALETLMAAAPDMQTAAAELQRAEDAVTAVRSERAQVTERLAALLSEIRTHAGNGIEERRDEAAGQLDAARATEAGFARQAAALTRLKAALEAERDAARETYFGPVQEELKPLLSILHGDAALRFDGENLLPAGLTRDHAEEALEDLSGGAKEQIAILTRLAFARLFARQDQQIPIILDDALVYSDDSRIIRMFTALTRVAQDQQILVFSCRQLAFQDLGGARPAVEVADV